MKRSSLILSGLLLFLLTAVGFWPVEVLTVSFPRGATPPLILARIPPDRIMTLTYLHSVEKTPVEGVFHITADGLFVIQQTRYTSVGSGLPTDFSDHPVREGDWFVVNEAGPATRSVRFFSIPENQMRLRLGAADLTSSRIQGHGLLELEVRQITLGHWWQVVLGEWWGQWWDQLRHTG